MMKKIVRGTLVGLAALFVINVSVAGQIALAQDAKSAIEKRQMAMKAIGGHMKAISEFLSAGSGSAEDVARRAAEISAAANMLPGLFPASSGKGMVDGVKTDALKGIWTDLDYFKRIFVILEKESTELQRVAMSGDKAAIRAQLGTMGEKTCSACHRDFRAR